MPKFFFCLKKMTIYVELLLRMKSYMNIPTRLTSAACILSAASSVIYRHFLLVLMRYEQATQSGLNDFAITQ